MGRRRAARFADGGECPTRGERPKLKASPHAAVAALHNAQHAASTLRRTVRSASVADGNAKRRVEDRERQAGETAELAVGQLGLLADALEQECQHSAVHHVHYVGEE